MKKILCLGDSITDADRLFSPNGLGYGYVNRLNTKLKGVKLINRGVDGFTVFRLLQSLDRSCIDEKPDLTTVLIGINDVGLMMNTDRTPAQQQEMLEEFARNYRLVLEKMIQQTDSKILLMEPFIFSYPREYVNWMPFVLQMSRKIETIASECHCLYLRFHDRLNAAAQELGISALTPDGIHLTVLGHEILSSALFQMIEQWIASNSYFIQHICQ